MLHVPLLDNFRYLRKFPTNKILININFTHFKRGLHVTQTVTASGQGAEVLCTGTQTLIHIKFLSSVRGPFTNSLLQSPADETSHV